MIDIFSKFPQYCEAAANLWLHEPLNVITNFSFIIGAFYLYRYIKASSLDRRLGIILVGFMVILGLGSLSWHSYRSIPTLWLDEIPIYIWVVFAFYFLTQSLTKSYKLTAIIMVLTATVYYLIFASIPSLNILQGSLKYVFALFVFLLLSLFVARKFGSHYNFILPLSILAVAIVFRSVDLPVCPVFPIGTHFLWHVSVALAVYQGSKVILRLDNERVDNRLKIYQ